MSTTLVFISFFCCLLIGTIMPSELMDKTSEDFISYFLDCMKEYPVTAADVETLKDDAVADSEAAKCMFACTYKKSGMMDDEGKLSVEGVRHLSEKYFADDPEMMKKSEDFTDACKHVNDAAVSDADRGCDRAVLLFRCSLEKAPSFGLF